MLLWLLSCVNLWSRSLFMSTLSDIINYAADVVVVARASAVKILLLSLVASVGANTYENEPSHVAFCDDSAMHLEVEFPKPFYGLLYTSGHPFSPLCSFPASPRLNNTKLMLTLPFRSCNFDVSALDEDRISVSGTIIVQKHRMVKTRYDTSLNVTCELYLPMNTFREWYYPNTSLIAGHLYTDGSLTDPEVASRLETRIGSDLFPDVSEVEEDLFLVISVRDYGENKDMSIQNCVAHDDEVLTKATLIYQLSDAFGCPNASYALKNFTVSNQTDGRGDLMAYTRLEQLSLIAFGEFFVSCGVVLCKNACHIDCEATTSRSSHYLTDIAVKRFVHRHSGATIPASLEHFDRQSARISKRSIVNSTFPLKHASRFVNTNFDTKVLALNSNGDMWMQTKNDPDIGILSQDRIEKVKLYFGNKTTRLFNLRTFVKSRKIWDRIAVSLLLLIFLGCYCGLLFWTRM